jgi:hypothetical protein
MLRVVWNIQGFRVVELLPKGATFRTDYCCEDILSEIFNACPARSNRRLIVHPDNARPHASKRTRDFMEKNNLRGAPHPPFSRDQAASYFFSFGHFKSKLQGTEFMEKDDLLAAIREISNGISTNVLKAVFI